MKSTNALRVLAELTSYQWGMVTSAQASMHGITRLDLSRLTQAGHLNRLAHGIYMDAGAPGDEFDDLRATWLSTDPKRLAEVRIKDRVNGVVVAGEAAALVHRIGDFPAQQYDFVAPGRRQSQRDEIRYRQRALDSRDIAVVEGLPVMTIERTIADLVEDLKDLSLVADALRDGSGKQPLDLPRLRELLAPLAERNGHRDGDALLGQLMEIAGLDLDSLAHRVAGNQDLGARVAASYFGGLSTTDLDQLFGTPEVQQALRPIQDSIAKALQNTLAPHLEKLGTTSKAAMENLVKNRGIEDAIRQISVPLIGPDIAKALSQSWMAALNDSIAIEPETFALAKAAQRAADGD